MLIFRYKFAWFYHCTFWIAFLSSIAMARVSVQLFSCYELPGAPLHRYGWQAALDEAEAIRVANAAAVEDFVANGGNVTNLTLCEKCAEADIVASINGDPLGSSFIEVRCGVLLHIDVLQLRCLCVSCNGTFGLHRIRTAAWLFAFF